MSCGNLTLSQYNLKRSTDFVPVYGEENGALLRIPARKKRKAQNNCSISPVRVSNSGRRIEFDVILGEVEHHIYYSAKNAELNESVETSIAAALLPLMVNGGGKCEIGGVVSERFLTSIEQIQDIYYAWEPNSQRVTFTDDLSVVKKQPGKMGTGVFFSGGVDSFYTLLQHKDEITDLIFVHGFDISIGQQSLYKKTSNAITHIAEQLGKNVIEIETNVRSLLDPYNSWEMSHGAAIASVGHLLSSHLRKIYIASTSTYTNLHPLGSHPFLDPLWSTESLEFIHDSCEVNRTEKTAFLAQHDIVLRTLRVCWQNPHETYNCGKCRKCLITMIDLYAAGMLEQCTTFDTPLDIRNVYKINIEGHVAFSYLRDNLLALEKRDLNPELRKALLYVLRKQRYFRELLNIMKKILKVIFLRMKVI